jgi:hypothetical protein
MSTNEEILYRVEHAGTAYLVPGSYCSEGVPNAKHYNDRWPSRRRRRRPALFRPEALPHLLDLGLVRFYAGRPPLFLARKPRERAPCTHSTCACSGSSCPHCFNAEAFLRTRPPHGLSECAALRSGRVCDHYYSLSAFRWVLRPPPTTSITRHLGGGCRGQFFPLTQWRDHCRRLSAVPRLPAKRRNPRPRRRRRREVP